MPVEHAHHVATVWYYLIGAGGQYVFSAFVSSMPPLSEPAPYALKWAYAFLHAVAANWDKVHVPGSPKDVASEPPADKKP